MKILIYSLYLPQGVCGVSNATRQLVASLEQKGIDVTVCTSDRGWPIEEISRQRSGKLRIFKDWHFTNADFAPDIFVYLRKNARKFDLIQLHGTFKFPTLFGAYAAKAAQIPYIICPRGYSVPSTIMHKHTHNAMRKRLFFWLIARNALRNANCVVCSSEVEQEAVRKQIHTDNVTYIENGLDYSTYLREVNHNIIKDKLGIDLEKPLFLFLGRLAKEKAILFLLDTWESIIQKMPEALLIIAGPIDSTQGHVKEITSRIATVSRPETVFMPGAVTGDLKRALLQHSCCLLLSSYFESFGNVVLEALISGTPVIASTGTPWKILEENRFGIWLPWKVKDWEEAMLNILNDDTYKNESFLRRSRNWVIENFNWSNIADRYIHIYEEIKKQHQR